MMKNTIKTERPDELQNVRSDRTFARVGGIVIGALACGVVLYSAVVPTTASNINLVTPAFAATGPVRAESIGTVAGLDEGEGPAFKTAAVVPASAMGVSGQLRAFVRDGMEPGIVRAAVTIGDMLRPATDFALITPRPASDSKNGRMGLYYLGKWPRAKTTKGGQVKYTPPEEFIEVTPDNADTKLSAHFRVRDFLTKDQKAVWPKYVAVNLTLIDKLELVVADLKARGIDASGVRVMSGFRTPQYNKGGGDPRGRASLSRHMYGDAADIYIDSRGRGRMDDLNGDGKVNIDDARVILASVDRVEQAHPSLTGGAGVYAGTSAHGPFIHIDTRGAPARWVGTGD
jgi:hypothetical protein